MPHQEDNQSLGENLHLGKNDSEYAEWLLAGLECWEFGSIDPNFVPFAEVRSLLSMHDHPLESLVNVYSMLSLREQRAFQRGIAKALQLLNDLSDQKKAILAERLTSLAVSIGAQKALEVASYMVDLASEDPNHRALLHQIIEGLARWVAPIDKGLCKPVYRLASARLFKAVHARRALLICTRADPDNLPSHLAKFHEHLQSRYNSSECQQSELRFIERRQRVIEILDIHPPKEVLEKSLIHGSVQVTADSRLTITSQRNHWWVASICEDSEVNRRFKLLQQDAHVSKPVRIIRVKSNARSISQSVFEQLRIDWEMTYNASVSADPKIDVDSDQRRQLEKASQLFSIVENNA